MLAQTAEALHAAHVAGVVHRDVKPGNILVLENGTIKVTDFGIARAVDSVALTEVGQVVGTARYISPEQAMGAEVTPASDIYSLGVIGFEMLTGQPPFTAGNVGALAMAHAHQSPPELPKTVPVDLRTAIARALAKDPSERPHDAHAFAATLRRLQLANLPPPGTPAEPDAALDASAPDTKVSGTQAPTRVMPTRVMPTRVMTAEEEPRTAIMPPGIVTRSVPSLGVSDQAYAARRQRRRLGISALAAVALIVVLALLRDAGGAGPFDPSIVTTTTPSAAFVDVDPNSLIGHSVADASQILTQAGLVVATRPVSAIGVPAGVVGGVQPIGHVPTGATVTLDISDGSTAITTAATTTEPKKGKKDGPGNGPGPGGGDNDD